MYLVLALMINLLSFLHQNKLTRFQHVESFLVLVLDEWVLLLFKDIVCRISFIFIYTFSTVNKNCAHWKENIHLTISICYLTIRIIYNLNSRINECFNIFFLR